MARGQQGVVLLCTGCEEDVGALDAWDNPAFAAPTVLFQSPVLLPNEEIARAAPANVQPETNYRGFAP